jgi:hexosaminidase
MWSFDPVETVAEEAQHLVEGGEACMWTEQVDENNLHPRVWPRAAAVAERLWSSRNNTDIGAAKKRLSLHRERLVLEGIAASPLHPAFCTRAPGSCDSHASGAGELSSRGVLEFPSSASATFASLTDPKP